MTCSIIENSVGISVVVVTCERDEHHVFDIFDAGDLEELSQVDIESFLGIATFSYALLDNLAYDMSANIDVDIEFT